MDMGQLAMEGGDGKKREEDGKEGRSETDEWMVGTWDESNGSRKGSTDMG
jgi:hypothetical protein